MHLFPWLCSALAATALAITTASREGTVQVDLAFPRNDTHAPTEWLPFVFTYQNAKPATYLNNRIHLDIWPYRVLGYRIA